MKTLFVLLLALLASTALAPSDAVGADDAAQQRAALASAQGWLLLSDKNDYGACWTYSSAYFQAAVSADKLRQTMTAVRTPLGPAIIRTPTSYSYSTSMPGAPDGEYITFQFQTRFAQKQAAVETVAMRKDSDGYWRVAGYYIR